MAGIKHSFASAKSDGSDSSLVKPSDWNADHTITGDVNFSTFGLSNVTSVGHPTTGPLTLGSSGSAFSQLSLTTDGLPYFMLTSTSDGPALLAYSENAGVNGPGVWTYHGTPSPANNDVVGNFSCIGFGSSGAGTTWSSIRTQIQDITTGSEDSNLNINIMSSGSEFTAIAIQPTNAYILTNLALNIAGGGGGVPLRVHSTAHASLQFTYQNEHGANSDNSDFAFNFVNSGSSVFQGAILRAQVSDITASTEDANLQFYTMTGGALAARLIVGPGVQVGSPTGGDQGNGTINVQTNIFRNSTAYANPDYALEHWDTGKIEKFKNNKGASEYVGLKPIGDIEGYMRENYRLPMPDRFRSEPIGIFDRTDILLEKMEEAWIYISQLHTRVTALESKST